MMEYKFHGNLTEINFKKGYTESEADLLKKGKKARSMDEKWDIFFEDNTLNFYRSWTRRGIFQIKFIEKENNLIVEKAFAEERFVNDTNAAYCSELLNWLIEGSFFQRKATFPRLKS
ncbi:MAG: hypothetical protein AAF617_07215 [Bacteroidota bacterium]